MDCKLFQMMPYIIILKVRKFHQPTANRFSAARQKPVREGARLNRVNEYKELTINVNFTIIECSTRFMTHMKQLYYYCILKTTLRAFECPEFENIYVIVSVQLRGYMVQTYSLDTFFIISTYLSFSHLISYLLVSRRKILGDAQAESNIFLQVTNKYDIRCEEDQ